MYWHLPRELKKLVWVYNGDWGNEPNPQLEAFKAARNGHFLRLPPEQRRAEALRAVRILASTVDTERPDAVRFISFSQCWTTDADLIYLREFPELEELDFHEDGAVTASGLAHLRDLKNLKSLRLAETGVTDLAPLKHLTGLEELGLSSRPKIEARSFRHLRSLKRLRKLNINFCRFDDAVMHPIGQLAALEELDMVYNNVTDEGFEQLSQLKNLKRVDVDYRDRRKDLLRRLLR
jgi:Leucine-rich repeat (LRR) protein